MTARRKHIAEIEKVVGQLKDENMSPYRKIDLTKHLIRLAKELKVYEQNLQRMDYKSK